MATTADPIGALIEGDADYTTDSQLNRLELRLVQIR